MDHNVGRVDDSRKIVHVIQHACSPSPSIGDTNPSGTEQPTQSAQAIFKGGSRHSLKGSKRSRQHLFHANMDTSMDGSTSNAWVESYLTCILSNGLSREYLKKPAPATLIDPDKDIYAQYYVQQILNTDEDGIVQAWQKAQVCASSRRSSFAVMRIFC